MTTITFLKISAVRDDANREISPEGHWVEFVFENAYGTHTLELNGRRVLPDQLPLREQLEFMLFDYGLLEQQDSRTARDRVEKANLLLQTNSLNHRTAIAYMERLGAPTH